MPISAIQATSAGRNGVGAFVLQCKRLEFHYCDVGGSSKGMRSFLKNSLPHFAKTTPTVEMHVSPRPNHHPVIRAHYINAPSRAICVRNLELSEVMEKAELLKQASGQKNKRIKGGRNVQSLNESVRGMWSGLHSEMAKARTLLEETKAAAR